MNVLMNSEMDKAYEPAKYESGIYAQWEQSGAFAPSDDPQHKMEPYCIIMPPPNANGILHTGHGMYTVEDIMIRFARKQGKAALWLPGTDHAGIETQVVFERELAKQGKSRFDYTREEFYDLAMKFTLDKQHQILDGFKSLGFSADWSRLKFTLDPDIIRVVYATFRQMHDDGLVYRANRIVNWCPHCHTGLADIELKHQSRIDPLYYIKYGPFVVATVRPETKFGDTALAVHPRDERYTEYVGQEVEFDDLLGKTKLKVIADDFVDPAFGTGVIKVTPAHDPNDWEISLRHQLEAKQAIGTDGRLTGIAGRYADMPVDEARTQVAHDLEERGLMDHVEMDYEHNVAIHDRCGTVIEPLVIEQWWVAVDKLKLPAIDVVKAGKIKFFPARFEKSYLNWLENLRDWNISRQIAWGIRIPVYYNASPDPNDKSKPDYIIAETEAEAEEIYGAGKYEAETDTFDTWFSSSQWPFATLQTSGHEGDFERFYPTAVMATMRDIQFLWVTRMVMLGIYRTGQIPFSNIYYWGAVNDAEGKKMSKSRGNTVDPQELTAQYGTDALRLALTIGITPGTGGSVSEAKVAGYRNFCNKLWNVARFTIGKLPDDYSPHQPELRTAADHWLAQKLTITTEQVTADMGRYRFSEAGQTIYALLWDDLADKYVEYAKGDFNADLMIMALETVLGLLHPIAPFVTEAIWSHLPDRPGRQSQLITEAWPTMDLKFDAARAQEFKREVIDVVARQDLDKKLAALEREITQKRNLIRITEAKLANPDFAKNAPTEIVEREQTLLAETEAQIKELEGELGKIKA